jgi:T5orf172 domain
MSTIDHVTLTPRKKRAASGADLRPYDFPATPESLPKSQSTPGAHCLPELVWDDTPESTKRILWTPSYEGSSPWTLSTDTEAPSTPTRPLKEPRRTNQIKDREASAERHPFESESCDHKPTLLFPLFLYPAQPAAMKNEDASMFDLAKGDIDQRSFEFSELSRRLHKDNTRSSTVTEAPVPDIPHVPKRVKLERYPIDQTTDYDPDTAADVQDISVKVVDGPGLTQIAVKSEGNSETKVTRQSSGTRDEGTRLVVVGAATRRFTRILPFNTIERLIEEPNRCVASLISQPNQRCSRLTKSCKDTKVWLLDYLSKLVAPKDLIAAESYLRELVKMATCTASRHRSIATEQLERLLYQFDESRHRDTEATKSRHNFTNRDGEVIPCWLEALTRLPDTHKNDSGHSLQQTYTSSKGLVPVAASISEPSSTSVSKEIPQITEARQKPVQEFRNVKTTNNVTTYTIETTETTHVTYDSAETLQTCETSKIIGVTETIDTSHNEQPAQTEETTHSVKATQPIRKIKTTQKTDAPLEAVVPLETTTKITTTHTVDRYSTFDPTQTVAVSFVATPAIKFTKNGDSGKRTQAAASKEEIIQTLNQTFKRYRPTASRKFSIEELIRARLVRPLSEQEQTEGIIYMFWVRGNFGLVKIGKTSGPSTANRLEQWRRSCGHQIEEHTRGEAEVAVKLPYVHRVEALVHAELNDSRLREISCKKCSDRKTKNKDKECLVSHKEWFRVSPDHAQKVIRKWSDWMLTNPYEKCNGEWRLKKAISAHKIDVLSTPIEKVKVPPPTLRRHSQLETPTKKAEGSKKM